MLLNMHLTGCEDLCKPKPRIMFDLEHILRTLFAQVTLNAQIEFKNYTEGYLCMQRELLLCIRQALRLLPSLSARSLLSQKRLLTRPFLQARQFREKSENKPQEQFWISYT